MTKPAIKVDGLWKEYAVGHAQERHDTFYELIGSTLKAPLKRMRKLGGQAEEKEKFWALQDINFEVQPGEVVGIIGRNGAGKSTLLKILSRITAPTKGQIEVRGRLASLLEVGTGFHPELSGRENIFLNGAILGMTRKEVARKFDEIVAFAEIEKFIDTPVKRYSSGMYVRLAFAVAAHLEPDILLVDEVLAVGDAQFQKRCLGKMGEVASGGRTIFFVSHNMQAVQSLCSKAYLLNQGSIAITGAPEAVIHEYLRGADAQITSQWIDEIGIGDAEVKLKKVCITNPNGGEGLSSFLSRNDLFVDMEVWVKQAQSSLCVGFDLIGEKGEVVFRSYDTDMRPVDHVPLKPGMNIMRCLIPRALLNAGRYFVAPRISIHNVHWIVNCDPLVSFEMALTHGESPFWNSLDTGNRPGVIAPILSWSRT